MLKKLDIVIFNETRNLTFLILSKLIKYRNKINIVAVVSDVKFKNLLIKNNFKDFKWISSSKKDLLKINKIFKNQKKDLYGFVCQYEWKIPESIINNFKMIINFHFGHIPKYRGHHPIIHGILGCEKFLYGTIHTIDKNFDKGKIIAYVKVYNNNKISSSDIEKKIGFKFSNYFEKILNIIFDNKKILCKKVSLSNGRFYSINSIKKLKHVKNYNEILTKTAAFDHPIHEPAYLKIKGTKIYLRLKQKQN